MLNLVGFAQNTTEDGETAEPESYQEAMDNAEWKEWKMQVMRRRFLCQETIPQRLKKKLRRST